MDSTFSVFFGSFWFLGVGVGVDVAVPVYCYYYLLNNYRR